jgi:uncharacterized protein (TIGR00730 family)
MLKKVTVFCASSNNIDKIFLDSAYNLGRELASRGMQIIYGGGKIGMMGRLADGAIDSGGQVKGVIPNFMMDIELGHTGVNELQVVKDMHERQAIMLKETDCVIALPGGSGTFVETLEAITWKRLGLFIMPIILVNISGYFDDFNSMMNNAIEKNFMRPEHSQLWTTVNTIEEAVGLVSGI